MINLWDYCTVDMFAHAFSIAVLAFSLVRLFNQIDKHNKDLWKMKDRINELGAWRDEDLNLIVKLDTRVSRLDQRVGKINSCKGCAPKKKASK